MALLRKAAPEDWRTIREICCRTGNSGEPIAADRWAFFGEQWVGPYEKLLPDWAYVASEGTSVQAYLTGCPRSDIFLKKRKLFFDLPLVWRLFWSRFFPAGAFRWNNDTRRFVRRTLHLDPWPEDKFSEKTSAAIRSEYPAHLHINADQEYRGRGVGRALISRFIEDLKPLHCPGIHVFCGAKPVAFYERLGFRELERIEFVPGVWIFCLGLKLSR